MIRVFLLRGVIPGPDPGVRKVAGASPAMTKGKGRTVR